MLESPLRTLAILWMMLGLTEGPVVGQEAVITLPDGAATQEGDATGYGPTTPGRGQWLFLASDFASLPPSLNQLVGFALRPDETAGPTTVTANRFTVRLSVTDVSTLGFAFDENFGETVHTAYDGPLKWTSTGMAGEPAKDFEYRLNFDEPFTYHPDLGNLLIEWTTTGITPSLIVDSVSYPDSSVMVSAFAFGSSPARATSLEPIAAAVELTFVPEPSSSLLAGLSLMGLALQRRRRHSS